MSSEKHESALKFLKTSIAGTLLTIVRVGTGFGRAKISALILGTAGVGVFAQGNQLLLLFSVLGSCSLAGGLVNQLTSPEHADRPEIRQRFLSTVFTVQTVLCLVVVVLTILGKGFIARMTFGTTIEQYKCIIVAFAVPFTVVATTGYFEAILFAAHRYDLYARALVIATVLGLFAFLGLVFFWGLRGAFISLPLAALLNFVLLAMAVAKVESLAHVFTFSIDLRALRTLFAFAATILPTAILGYGSVLLIRRQVLITLGPEANGLLQVPLAITSYYTPLITQALWGRLHPAISASGPGTKARDELVTALRIVAMLTAMMVIGIITFGELAVRIVYSSAFGSASRLLIPELFGDYWYLIALSASVYFLGTARLRVYLAGWVAYYGIYILTTLTNLKALDILALPVGYMVSGLVMAVAALTWLVVVERNRATFQTLAVIGMGAVAIAVQSAVVMFAPSHAYRSIVPLGCAAVMAYRFRTHGWQGLLTA